MSGSDWDKFDNQKQDGGWGEFEDEQGNIIQTIQEDYEEDQQLSNDDWGHGIKGLQDNANRRMRRPIKIPVPEPLEDLSEEENFFEPLSPRTRRLLEIAQMSPISGENARLRFDREDQDLEYEIALAEDLRLNEIRLKLEE